jgi:hypothetical protein
MKTLRNSKKKSLNFGENITYRVAFTHKVVMVNLLS